MKLIVKNSSHAPQNEFFAFRNDELLREEEIHSFLSKAENFDDFLQRCNSLNGAWNIALEREDSKKNTELFLAVDHRATKPLFYRQKNNEELIISDNGFELLDPSEKEIHPRESDELFFSQWGFTAEEQTLHPEIKRLPAGFALRFSSEKVIERKRYTIGFHKRSDLEGIDFEEAKKEAKRYLSQAFNRMIKVIEGNPIVLPLTAGRDSRLIATALKERNYPEVQTLTYGKTEKTFEVQRASLIAKRLDFRHEYIPTIPQHFDKKGYTEDQEVINYFKHMSGLGSGYFFAEYNAAKKIAKDFGSPYVLPGHNGDILCRHSEVFSSADKNQNPTINSYLLTFFEGGDRTLTKAELGKVVSLQEEVLRNYPAELSMRERLEIFRTQELSSKYYINSSRSWSFFSSRILMPFLDRDLIDFFGSLPLEFRKGRRIWEEVTNEIFKQHNIAFPDDKSELAHTQSIKYKLKNIIRPFVIYPITQRRRPFGVKEDIGFKKLMSGSLAKEVQENIPWKATSINGLSFAWWLMRLKKGNF